MKYAILTDKNGNRLRDVRGVIRVDGRHSDSTISARVAEFRRCHASPFPITANFWTHYFITRRPSQKIADASSLIRIECQ